MEMGLEIEFSDVQTGNAERGNHNQSCDDKGEPVGLGWSGDSGTAGAVKYYYGKDEQCKRDKDWSQNRTSPGGWY
jgi:hypothetical protein